MAGGLFFLTRRLSEVGLFELACGFAVGAFDFGEIAQLFPNIDVSCAFGRLLVKARSLKFHRLRFLADGVERQVL